MDQQFENVDRRFESIDQQFDRVHEQFSRIDTQFQRVDDRFTRLEACNDALKSSIASAKIWALGLYIALAAVLLGSMATGFLWLAERLPR